MQCEQTCVAFCSFVCINGLNENSHVGARAAEEIGHPETLFHRVLLTVRLVYCDDVHNSPLTPLTSFVRDDVNNSSVAAIYNNIIN